MSIKKEQKKCMSVHIRLLQVAERRAGPAGIARSSSFPHALSKRPLQTLIQLMHSERIISNMLNKLMTLFKKTSAICESKS